MDSYSLHQVAKYNEPGARETDKAPVKEEVQQTKARIEYKGHGGGVESMYDV